MSSDGVTFSVVLGGVGTAVPCNNGGEGGTPAGEVGPGDWGSSGGGPCGATAPWPGTGAAPPPTYSTSGVDSSSSRRHHRQFFEELKQIFGAAVEHILDGPGRSLRGHVCAGV